MHVNTVCMGNLFHIVSNSMCVCVGANMSGQVQMKELCHVFAPKGSGELTATWSRLTLLNMCIDTCKILSRAGSYLWPGLSS